MKKLILLIFLSVTVISAYGQADTAKLSRIIQEQITGNYFEGTVLVAEKGNIIYQRSAGYKDRGSGSMIENDTKFGIASITKMLTAIVILQLAEEGRLSLQDNMEDLLPELGIPNGKNITVHHLLLHISGLPNENDSVYLNTKTPVEFVKKVLTDSPKSGELGEFNYANIDYILLGLITEKLTGKRWEDVISERIIQKLDLKNTGFLSNTNYPDNFAHSYSVQDDGNFIKDPDIHIENFYSAGCMYSNAFDLLAIDQAMYGNILLSEKAKNLMYTSYPEYNYTGYSVWTYNYPFADTKPRIMERRGGIMGWNSVLVRMLDVNKTIIILSNNKRFNPDSFGEKENLREALIIELAKTE